MIFKVSLLCYVPTLQLCHCLVLSIASPNNFLIQLGKSQSRSFPLGKARPLPPPSLELFGVIYTKKKKKKKQGFRGARNEKETSFDKT